MQPLPDFRSPEFLLAHMREIMDFYYPICLNQEDGGYYNEYRDDGFITDRTCQHIVSTTRFIFNFALAAGIFDRADFKVAAGHGLRHLSDVHRDPVHGGISGFSIGTPLSIRPSIATAMLSCSSPMQ